MFRPLPLFIGFRYTRAKRGNGFISFISLSSIIGLALGVSVLIVVLSVMNGFDRELQVRILGMVPQASIEGPEPVAGWEEARVMAESNPRVVAAAPFIQLEGMLSHRGAVAGALVTGIDPEMESPVSIIGDSLRSGDLGSLEPGSFNIILGFGLASNLGVSIGDKVTLVLSKASVTPAGLLPRFKRLTVSGVFKVGAEVDGLMAYINLEDAARLNRAKGKVQGIRLKVSDLFAAKEIAAEVASGLGGDWFPTDWSSTHGGLFQAVKLEKMMMVLLLLLIVAVAAFNIVSSLVMVVIDKKGEIAILRTLGASPAMILGTFMVQGTIIGGVGTLAGAVMGTVLALNLTDFSLWLERFLDTPLFSAYFVSYLPTDVQSGNIIFVSALAFVMSFLATVYPALRASRIQPAEVLRYE